MPNSSLIHADIFFFITTIAVAIVTAGLVIALVYAIGILKDVREMTDKAKAEWHEIVGDSKRLRSALRDEGLKWKHVVDLVRTFFVRDAEKKRAAKAAKVKAEAKGGARDASVRF